MRSRRFLSMLALLGAPLTLAAGYAGCGSSATTTARGVVAVDVDGDGQGAVMREVSVEATAGPDVTRLALSCASDASETCNAVDDDCDARVDEGCGYGPGAVQVTATWGTRADLDLLVTDPDGDSIGGETPTAVRGTLDRGSRGACGDTDDDSARIEDVTFPAANEGTYRIALQHRDACVDGDDDTSATPASVTVVVGAAILGTWNLAVAPGARSEVVTVAIRTEPH